MGKINKKISIICLCFFIIFLHGGFRKKNLHDFENIPEWMQKQINLDFAPFEAIDPASIDAAAQENPFGALLLCEIKGRSISIQAVEPRYRDFFQIDHLTSIFKKFLRRYKLPNMKFLLSMHDGIVTDNPTSVPVLAYAKNVAVKNVVLIPDFQALEGNHYFHEQVNLGLSKWPYEQKIPLAYWSGATSGGYYSLDCFLSLPRTQLVSFSLKFPDLLYARFVPTFLNAYPEGEKIHVRYPEYFAEFVDISESMKYKYQILADGNSCAWSRAYWQLHANCLMIKQDSPHIQWFYSALAPYVHYVPTSADFSDLADKIAWARDNDVSVEKITLNAQRFAQENLIHEKVFVYLYHVLKRYAELIQN